MIKLLCLKKYRLTALEVLSSLFLHVKKSVSAQSTSIISHTFDEILEIYKKYFQVAIQNLIIILFHLLYSHSTHKQIFSENERKKCYI